MAGSVFCFFCWVGPAVSFQLTRRYLVFDHAAFELSFGNVDLETGLLAFHGADYVEQVATPGVTNLREILNSHPTSYVLFTLYMCPFIFSVWVDLKLAWTCFRAARLLGGIAPPDPENEDAVLYETWVQRHRRLGRDFSHFKLSWTQVQKEMLHIRDSGALVAQTIDSAASCATAGLASIAEAAARRPSTFIRKSGMHAIMGSARSTRQSRQSHSASAVPGSAQRVTVLPE